MKKPLKLILLGLLPLVPGYLLNVFIFVIPTSLFSLIQYVFLVLWGIMAYLIFSEGNSVLKNLALLHIVPFFFLALLLFQELVLGRYLDSIIGILPQLYFAPMLVPAYLFSSFITSSGVWLAYIFEFILMTLFSLAGCLLKKRRLKTP